MHKVTRRAANAKHPSPFLQVCGRDGAVEGGSFNRGGGGAQYSLFHLHYVHALKVVHAGNGSLASAAQVDIELPKLESASEASVKTGKHELALAAGNTYRLKVLLCIIDVRDSYWLWK